MVAIHENKISKILILLTFNLTLDCMAYLLQIVDKINRNEVPTRTTFGIFDEKSLSHADANSSRSPKIYKSLVKDEHHLVEET